jgi:hypothetical protein
MRDLASAMTSSSELCFRRALTDIPTRVDCKASSLGWEVVGTHPRGQNPLSKPLTPTGQGGWGPTEERQMPLPMATIPFGTQDRVSYPQTSSPHLTKHQRKTGTLSSEQFVPTKAR